MATLPFQSILYQAKRGEPEAFAHLHTQYLPIIRDYVSRTVPIDSVEDITSEVFFKILDAIHEFYSEDESAFRAWVRAIARTTIASHYHARSRVQIFPLEAATNAVSPDDPTQPIETIECITALSDAMRKLSTDQRRIVVGRVVQDQPARSLALQLGKSEAAIYHDQYRALAKLRKDKNLRQWIIRIILMFIAGGAFAYAGIVSVGNAGPGSPLYPIRQLWASPAGDSGTVNHRDTFPRVPIFTPTMAPTATPTPTPSPTPIVSRRTSRTVPVGSGGILDTAATALPLQSSTPVACILDTCLGSPLP